MANFTSDFTISAGTKEEAQQKMAAIKIIVSKLNTKQLLKLAEVIEQNGTTMAMAKKMLGV